ncbi:histone H1-like [Senna tora]|uniref:Histone H1-like n=1 Tax=Senna tora TaxID=362788 RepID=A0A834WEN4_9FABA|nr:histone H1-like [Senna tora]
MAKANAKDTSTSTAGHPPYFHMIADAISTLNDRTGSSQQAIAKFIEDKHHNLLPPNFRTLLSVQLRKFVKSERLFKVKNSFKISSTDKLKLAIHESRTNKKIAEKDQKGLKTKRLSHVKTPEALKKPKPNKGTITKKKSVASSAGKVKSLSQVKTPEALKSKTKTNATSAQRKTTSKPIASSRPARKARK